MCTALALDVQVWVQNPMLQTVRFLLFGQELEGSRLCIKEPEEVPSPGCRNEPAMATTCCTHWLCAAHLAGSLWVNECRIHILEHNCTSSEYLGL